MIIRKEIQERSQEQKNEAKRLRARTFAIDKKVREKIKFNIHTKYYFTFWVHK